MRDLDIRGAGDLLGADQSGFINEIGFETYQKILNEAIEELKEEEFQGIFENEKEKFYIKDCQIETDLEVLIPDTYVSNIEERLNLYKELNQLQAEDGIVNFIKQLEDRFGKIPKEILTLCDALRLRWLGKKIGFEKVILRNGVMRSYFTSNSDSPYYKSASFSLVLDYLKANSKNCNITEKKGKLSFIVSNVPTLKEVLVICKSILKG